MVVGNQPTPGQVAAQLLGSPVGEMSIKTGAIWWFATRERGNGQQTVLRAMLNPDFV